MSQLRHDRIEDLDHEEIRWFVTWGDETIEANLEPARPAAPAKWWQRPGRAIESWHWRVKNRYDNWAWKQGERLKDLGWKLINLGEKIQEMYW